MTETDLKTISAFYTHVINVLLHMRMFHLQSAESNPSVEVKEVRERFNIHIYMLLHSYLFA